MKNARLFSVLRSTAVADREKALMTLELLSQHPAGIGDHSTGDFYKNAEEALGLLADAEDRLEMLNRHFPDQGAASRSEAARFESSSQPAANVAMATSGIPPTPTTSSH